MFSFSVFSLSLETDKDLYKKGEEILLNALCSGNSLVVFSASTVEGKKIFEFTKECLEGAINESMSVGFADPSGKWVIEAVSGEERAQTNLEILKTPETQFFLITVLSPSFGDHYRAEDLNILIRVTDAGQIVENAEVKFFDLNGNPVRMNYFGNGMYSSQFNLPFDAELKDWELFFVAAKEQNGGFFGGEKSF
ncbi:MAG: hypothetical protein Q7K42_05655, partial [Candidatus Diapherotrites archaeon]|nr:hypothetical protein [Candidatus Diapherotrites archaeon]